MKGLEYVAIVAVLVFLWYLTSTRENFVPTEFADRTNDKLTEDNSYSSYSQKTNHMVPTHPLMGNAHGIETPFRVNMFNSFQPV